MLDELDRLLAFAKDAYEKEDVRGKIGYLKDALNIATNKSDVAFIYEEIGLSFYGLGDIEEAKNNYYLAIETLSAVPESEALDLKWSINYNLGAAFFADGDYKNALKYNLEALKYIEHIDPKDAFMVILAIGVNYEKLDILDKAIDFYHRALKFTGLSNEDKTMIYQFLGQSYDKRSDEKLAFDYFYKVFSINPNYEGGWYFTYRYAQLAYRFKNYEVALSHLKKIINEIPSDQKSYLQSSRQCLGYIYLERKEYKSAIDEFNKALNVRVNTLGMWGDIYCGLAQAYLGLDKTRKTIKFALRALDEEIDKKTEEIIYFLLAYSYSLKKDKENEGYYTEKLRGVKPDSAYLRELDRF